MIAATLIHIPQWGNMTLIEAVWMGSGFLAMIVTGSHMLPLWSDWVTMVMQKREALAAVAWDNLRREILRFVEGCVPAGIGVYASIQPPVLPGPAVISPIGLAITGLFIANSLVVSLQSKMDWVGRYKVQRLIRKTNGNGNGHAAVSQPTEPAAVKQRIVELRQELEALEATVVTDA